MAQENFRLEMEACRNYIQSLDEDMNIFKADRKNQVLFVFSDMIGLYVKNVQVASRLLTSAAI